MQHHARLICAPYSIIGFVVLPVFNAFERAQYFSAGRWIWLLKPYRLFETPLFHSINHTNIVPFSPQLNSTMEIQLMRVYLNLIKNVSYLWFIANSASC